MKLKPDFFFSLKDTKNSRTQNKLSRDAKNQCMSSPEISILDICYLYLYYRGLRVFIRNLAVSERNGDAKFWANQGSGASKIKALPCWKCISWTKTNRSSLGSAKGPRGDGAALRFHSSSGAALPRFLASLGLL